MSMRRKVAAALTGALMVGACGSDEGTTGPALETVAEQEQQRALVARPGRANWTTGYFQAAVYAALLQELGYTVSDPSLHEYPPFEAYPAMAVGTFDFWANGWYSQHDTHLRAELEDGSIVGDHLIVLGDQIPLGGLEGLLITKAVADEYGIESLAQINDDPELVALFDTDGNGRAEVHGCPEDWTCDDIIDEMITFNNWSNIEQVKAGYPGLAARSIERVEAGEPVIQYTWSPSSYLSRMIPGENVYWLSVGTHDNVLDGTTPGEFDFSGADAAPLGDACSADPCWMGWEVADIRVTANAAFAAANPMAVALFEAIELTVSDVAAENVLYDAGENTEADVRRHAAEWIAANRSTVDEWLAAASAAA